jgi:hypothetical protein
MKIEHYLFFLPSSSSIIHLVRSLLQRCHCLRSVAPEESGFCKSCSERFSRQLSHGSSKLLRRNTISSWLKWLGHVEFVDLNIYETITISSLLVSCLLTRWVIKKVIVLRLRIFNLGLSEVLLARMVFFVLAALLIKQNFSNFVFLNLPFLYQRTLCLLHVTWNGS